MRPNRNAPTDDILFMSFAIAIKEHYQALSFRERREFKRRIKEIDSKEDVEKYLRWTRRMRPVILCEKYRRQKRKHRMRPNLMNW